jgi:hypothetical protein
MYALFFSTKRLRTFLMSANIYRYSRDTHSAALTPVHVVFTEVDFIFYLEEFRFGILEVCISTSV